MFEGRPRKSQESLQKVGMSLCKNFQLGFRDLGLGAVCGELFEKPSKRCSGRKGRGAPCMPRQADPDRVKTKSFLTHKTCVSSHSPEQTSDISTGMNGFSDICIWYTAEKWGQWGRKAPTDQHTNAGWPASQLRGIVSSYTLGKLISRLGSLIERTVKTRSARKAMPMLAVLVEVGENWQMNR